MADGKFISYIRVSTDKQERSGLGLEAQQAAVRAYLNGGAWELKGEFVEVESGKRNDRPELAKALAACKKHGATLVVAKLDRLSRSVAFLSALMESGAEFVACDNPEANKLMLHMLAAFAEHERDMIGKRTKEGLAAAKARGTRLGNTCTVLGKTLADAQAKGAAANAVQADTFAANVLPIVRQIEAAGAKTLRQIADALNARGVRTARGGAWAPMTVKRLVERAA